MRRARITFPGSYHHVMNRGYNGNDIFKAPEEKEHFLELLKQYSIKLNIRMFSYVLMDNHYHLILENSSGRMSDFIKQLNGNYGTFFRKKHGGKGYVFQGRYKSTLIQNDEYLLLAIAYSLRNPVRAGIENDFLEYQWSSASAYFNKSNVQGIVDANYVEGLFGQKQLMVDMVNNMREKMIPAIDTKFGKIMGTRGFFTEALKKFDRRGKPESLERKRIDDHYFDPVEKIYMEIEKKYNVSIEEIDLTTYSGKKIRSELLFQLRDRGGLKYSDIIKMDVFSDLKLHSLGRLYKRTKQRLAEK